MDSEKIVQQLNQRFAAPLPEFYKRRIVFWYDEDKEFEDKLDEVELTNAKMIILTGTNNFEVKKLLGVDDTTSNYLVYCPLSYEKPEDNWLIDIELYSEEFRADLISIWMDEMGIPATPALRKLVKTYRKYFNAKNRRDKIVGQSKAPEVPAQLHMAVMGALCNIKDVTPGAIIKEILKAGLDTETNLLYEEFVSYGADTAFWSMVQQGTGYVSEQPNLAQLATHMILTATTRTMRLEYLAGLDQFISSPHQAYCYDFVSDWLHSEDSNQLYEIARTIEDEAKLHKRFMKLEVDDLVDTECFPCLHEVILIKLMTEISDHIIDVDAIKRTVEKRRTCIWYDEVKDFYEGLLQVANMQEFFKDHSAGFHAADAKKLWREYTEEYYKMDTYYRLFHKSYGESLKSYHSGLHDLFSHVMEKVEGLYSNWFLGQLGANWHNVCGEDYEKYGKVLEIPEQKEFYKRKIHLNYSRI